MIDFHSHLIPGVDDGAASLDEARAALGAFQRNGVTTVLTTPHLQGSTTVDPAAHAAWLQEVDAGWETLAALAAAEFPTLRLERGAEVMLDTPAPELAEPRVRLAGTSFVLVEFPFMTVPPHATQALFELKVRGWTPVIAHPERYHNVQRSLADAAEWRRIGAYLQVNCGSVVGRYGPEARARAWALLRAGMADYLSSDHHARGGLHVAACRAAIEERGGQDQVRLLLEENAGRLLENRLPEPVPPLERQRSFLARLFARK